MNHQDHPQDHPPPLPNIAFYSFHIPKSHFQNVNIISNKQFKSKFANDINEFGFCVDYIFFISYLLSYHIIRELNDFQIENKKITVKRPILNIIFHTSFIYCLFCDDSVYT